VSHAAHVELIQTALVGGFEKVLKAEKAEKEELVKQLKKAVENK